MLKFSSTQHWRGVLCARTPKKKNSQTVLSIKLCGLSGWKECSYVRRLDETLIIVTADHETGGLVLGYNGNYALYFKELTKQKVSVNKLQAMLNALGTTTWGKVNEVVKENSGVSIRGNHNENDSVEMTSDIAGRIAAEAIYDIDRKAAISWASGNHSGTYVPLYAIGCGAEEFHGVMDNTDIPKTIEKVAQLNKDKRKRKR